MFHQISRYKVKIIKTPIRTFNDEICYIPNSWNQISCYSFRFWLCFEDAYQEKKLPTLNKSSKLYVGISASVLLWFKDDGGPQFGRVLERIKCKHFTSSCVI